eukprot:CAMPEP_0170174916 /NCGR_PEP_ID=MMETSP0040_2-20121228/8095_1 /TAXON_ID=641309 /ORGANISM="Lotharella oceanica, Strain CCMP622" /LENGTH=469 /DNA_ID=CAMNT_0010416741 /DNA_START=156 /DNA_END=1565 /DNA_ORIENTATION=+
MARWFLKLRQFQPDTELVCILKGEKEEMQDEFKDDFSKFLTGHDPRQTGSVYKDGNFVDPEWQALPFLRLPLENEKQRLRLYKKYQIRPQFTGFAENLVVLRPDGTVITQRTFERARINKFSDEFPHTKEIKDQPEVKKFDWEEWREPSSLWEKMKATGPVVNAKGETVPVEDLQKKDYIIWLLGAHWQEQYMKGLPHLLKWYKESASSVNAEVVWLYMGQDADDCPGKRSPERQKALDDHLQSLPWLRFQNVSFYDSLGINSTEGVPFVWKDHPYSPYPPELVVHAKDGVPVSGPQVYTKLIQNGRIEGFPWKPQAVQKLDMSIRMKTKGLIFVGIAQSEKDSKEALKVLTSIAKKEKGWPYPDEIETFAWCAKDTKEPDCRKLIQRIASDYEIDAWPKPKKEEEAKDNAPVKPAKPVLTEVPFFLLDGRYNKKMLYLGPKGEGLTQDKAAKMIADFHNGTLTGGIKY